MKVKIFCVKDAVSGSWLSPTFDSNDEVAFRNFSHAIQSSGTVLSTHREDFSLFCIGTFDTESGVIEKIDHYLIVNGGDIK